MAQCYPASESCGVIFALFARYFRRKMCADLTKAGILCVGSVLHYSGIGRAAPERSRAGSGAVKKDRTVTVSAVLSDSDHVLTRRPGGQF